MTIEWNEQQEFGKAILVLLEQVKLDEEKIIVVDRPRFFNHYMVKVAIGSTFGNARDRLSSTIPFEDYECKIVYEFYGAHVYLNDPALLMRVGEALQGYEDIYVSEVHLVSKLHADDEIKQRSRPLLWFGKYAYRVTFNVPIRDVLTQLGDNRVDLHRNHNDIFVYCNEDDLVVLRMSVGNKIRDIFSRTPSGKTVKII